jgi:hypothetical protein
MTYILLQKTLPTSNLYTGSGVTIILLSNFDKMVITSKSEPIKIQLPKTKKSQNTIITDLPNNMVIDLKKITQTITLSGWLEDDATETAWNKYWKLIAMQTRGGPLTQLTIGSAAPQYFPSGAYSGSPKFPTNTPQAFLTSVTGEIISDDTGDITASHSAKPARIRVDLEIYLGYER